MSPTEKMSYMAVEIEEGKLILAIENFFAQRGTDKEQAASDSMLKAKDNLKNLRTEVEKLRAKLAPTQDYPSEGDFPF